MTATGPSTRGSPVASPTDSLLDLAAAGGLLGHLHAASSELTATGIPGSAAQRWEGELREFASTTLPAIRDAGLPIHPVSLDHRATNLLHPAGRTPVLVDPDNAESAPRLLDLAVSVLLFASEARSNPGHLFDGVEWAAFKGAYLDRVELTATERRLWPTAVRYMRLEWGCWQLTEGAEWDLPHQRGYLLDLLTMNDHRYPL